MATKNAAGTTLSGQRALVTGANSGIGAGVATGGSWRAMGLGLTLEVSCQAASTKDLGSRDCGC